MYYCLQGKKYKTPTPGIPQLTAPMVKQVEIPVPELVVQERIVDVLDNFDKICTDLNVGLLAEINARQKQYKFYRDQILTFAETGSSILTDRQSLIRILQYVFGWCSVYLDDISENLDNKRKPVASDSREKGDIPYYGASGIVDYEKNYIFDGDYLLISEDGANLTARVTPIAFFVEMYLNSIDLSFYITGAAQPKLNQKNLNMIPIPLPSIERQKKIVGILDRFEKICDDVKDGLPAEIMARQKQYKYYRDKFLTFDVKEQVK